MKKSALTLVLALTLLSFNVNAEIFIGTGVGTSLEKGGVTGVTEVIFAAPRAYEDFGIYSKFGRGDSMPEQNILRNELWIADTLEENKLAREQGRIPKKIPLSRYKISEKTSLNFTAGITYSYKSYIGYLGGSYNTITIEESTKDITHILNSEGVDVGIWYVLPFNTVVGAGYNSATNTAIIQVGQLF